MRPNIRSIAHAITLSLCVALPASLTPPYPFAGGRVGGGAAIIAHLGVATQSGRAHRAGLWGYAILLAFRVCGRGRCFRGKRQNNKKKKENEKKSGGKRTAGASRVTPLPTATGKPELVYPRFSRPHSRLISFKLTSSIAPRWVT